MLFTDALFLFYFLPAALFVHWLTTLGRSRPGGYRNVSRACIFLVTIVFYGFNAPWQLVPFLICVCFDFLWATLLARTERPGARKLLCGLSVTQNLILLGTFKYSQFFARNLAHLSPGLAGLVPNFTLDGAGLPLPPGISFYTFESLSFVIDVYRRQIEAPKNPLEFFGFIAMFPRFIAGPIVRYRDMVSQFREYAGMQVESGLFLFIIGLFLKTCFADSFATLVPIAFGRSGAVDLIPAWIGAVSYSMQLYFDFAGYSLMAIGLGRCLGFRFCANFNRPYLATSVQDFWRRWHMSLSSWLRDYLYIPLGGNRKGPLRTYLNLFLTMAIGGLWHGADWTFVVWGAWHGLALCLERGLGFQSRLVTLAVALVGWVLFRASKLPEAFKIMGSLFNVTRLRPLDEQSAALLHANGPAIALAVAGLVFCFGVEPWLDLNEAGEVSWTRRATALAALTCSLSLIFSTRTIPFLYFQF